MHDKIYSMNPSFGVRQSSDGLGQNKSFDNEVLAMYLLHIHHMF